MSAEMIKEAARLDATFLPYAPPPFADVPDATGEATEEEFAKWNRDPGSFKRKTDEETEVDPPNKKKVKLAPTESKEKRAEKMRLNKTKKAERLAVIATIATGAGSDKASAASAARPPPLPLHYKRPDEKAASKLKKERKSSTLDGFVHPLGVRPSTHARYEDDDDDGNDDAPHSGERRRDDTREPNAIIESEWFHIDLPSGEIIAVLRSDETVRRQVRPPTDFELEYDKTHEHERKTESQRARYSRIERMTNMPVETILGRWREIDRAFKRKPSASDVTFRRSKVAYIRAHFYIPFNFDTDPIFGRTPHTPQTTDDRIVAAYEWESYDAFYARGHAALITNQPYPVRYCMLEPRREDAVLPDFTAVSQLPILTMAFQTIPEICKDKLVSKQLLDKANTQSLFRHRNWNLPLFMEGLPSVNSSFGHSAAVLWRINNRQPRQYARFKETYQTNWKWWRYLSYSDTAKLARVCRSFRVDFDRQAAFIRPLRLLAEKHPSIPQYEIELTEHAARVLLFLLRFNTQFSGHIGQLRGWAAGRLGATGFLPSSFPASFMQSCKLAQFFSPESKRREFFIDEKQPLKITPKRVVEIALAQLESMERHLNDEIDTKKAELEPFGSQVQRLRQFCNMNHGALPLARKSKSEKEFTQTVGDCVFWKSDYGMKFSVRDRKFSKTTTRKFFYLSILNQRRRFFFAVNLDTGDAYCDHAKQSSDDELLLVPVFKITTDEHPERFREWFPRLSQFYPEPKGNAAKGKKVAKRR
jgi:hypothetical protein